MNKLTLKRRPHHPTFRRNATSHPVSPHRFTQISVGSQVTQPRVSFGSRARCKRTHVHNGLHLTQLSLDHGSILGPPTPPQEQRILPSLFPLLVEKRNSTDDYYP